MCNRYLKDATWVEEVEHYKEIDAWRRRIMADGEDHRAQLSNYANEVYPGYKGLVFTMRGLEAMAWGFPRAMVSEKTGKPLKPRPINNTRTENLGSPFWRDSFSKRRCLIPLTRFAEAEGPKGAMTCTWFGMPDGGLFSCAGIWRESAEWGAVYSMMMTECCDTVRPVHDRMPVVLRPEDYETWLGGHAQEALALCKPWEGEIAMERTPELWFKR